MPVDHEESRGRACKVRDSVACWRSWSVTHHQRRHRRRRRRVGLSRRLPARRCPDGRWRARSGAEADTQRHGPCARRPRRDRALPRQPHPGSTRPRAPRQSCSPSSTTSTSPPIRPTMVNLWAEAAGEPAQPLDARSSLLLLHDSGGRLVGGAGFDRQPDHRTQRPDPDRVVGRDHVRVRRAPARVRLVRVPVGQRRVGLRVRHRLAGRLRQLRLVGVVRTSIWPASSCSSRRTSARVSEATPDTQVNVNPAAPGPHPARPLALVRLHRPGHVPGRAARPPRSPLSGSPGHWSPAPGSTG